MRFRVGKLQRLIGTISVLSVCLPAALGAHTAHERAGIQSLDAPEIKDIGILVVAPDRGFRGNQELIDAVEPLMQRNRLAVAFATRKRPAEALQTGLEELEKKGAGNIVVAPLFLAESDPRWKEAVSLLPRLTDRPVSTVPVFGRTHFAVKLLVEHLSSADLGPDSRIALVGEGAREDGDRDSIAGDLQDLVDRAAADLRNPVEGTYVWAESDQPAADGTLPPPVRSLQEAAGQDKALMVVPFHFGKKLDGMMRLNASLRRALPPSVPMEDCEVDLRTTVPTWLEWVANHFVVFKPKDVGVLVMPHGSDWHWNETIRRNLRPLEKQYAVEYAFSMADRDMVERGIRRLEARGVRGIVVVRVFGLESAFRETVERMIGQDGSHHAHPGGGHGAGHEMSSLPILSKALLATTGGMEADPLFAAALLDRARALSRNPSNEMILLTAHGAGEDERNVHWLHVLAELAGYMKEHGGSNFHDITYGTWREDWPEKREIEVGRIRGMVEAALKTETTVIVIPARTTGVGPEEGLLKGLDFKLGEGFAPHPNFLRWVGKRIQEGLGQLQEEQGEFAVLLVPARNGRAAAALP